MMKSRPAGAKGKALGRVLKALYLILILIFLYLPIGTLMVLSFNKSKSMSVWTGFTTDWYAKMFANHFIT